MTATQTPASTEAGAGRVVDANQTTHTSSYRRQTTKRRTNLLSVLSPAERKAFLQEQLDQSAIFRQIACAKNGVTGPIDRNLIGDEPSEEEIQEEAVRSGVSENEVRRREDIARREALVEVREEVIRQQEEMAKTKPDAAPVAPPTEPGTIAGISEEEASKREQLAGKEAALAAREQALQGQAAKDEQIKQAQAAAEEARRKEQAAQAERDRLQAERDRLEDEARRRQNTGTTPAPVSPPPTQPTSGTVNNDDEKFWTTPKVAAATGLGGAALAGLVAWGMSGDPDDTVADTNTPGAKVEVVASDRETLLLLESRGLSAPRTPLGEKILEAFEKDPSLRERVMVDVEQTLLSE